MFDTFAWAGLLGMDVEKMINGSPLDFSVRLRITRAATRLRDDMDDSLALAIVNRLAESVNKK
jgi:hypothetical protein